MTQHQALAIKIPALAYCCRNRGWFHTASVTHGPESTNSTFDCQWLSGHRPWRKSGYVSLANRERNRVFTGSRMSVAGKHTAVGWWEWGVLFAIKGSCRPPLARALVVFSDRLPSGSQKQTAPCPCVRRMKVLVSSQSAPGHLSLTLVHYGRTRIR